jgi:hypothetical protein
MPVEEIEETKTVEETTTKEVVICDSCGVNDDTGDNRLYQFYGQSIQKNLYFCGECLDNENTRPITEGITTPFPTGSSDKDRLVTGLTSATTIAILGFAGFGIAGLFGGLILFFVLALVFTLLYEVFNQ